MGYRHFTENWRVDVKPKVPWIGGWDSDQHQQRACEELRLAIMRHVDCEFACVEHDNVFVCEHCGCPWTEGKTAKHNGGCCDKDCEAMEPEIINEPL